MASVKQIQVTFDCAEPVRVSRFWAETLGYRPEYDDEQGDWAAAFDPTGAGAAAVLPTRARRQGRQESGAP